MRQYLADEYHICQTDRDKAMASHLRQIAKQINTSAKRFTEHAEDSLCGSDALHPFHIEDAAIQDAVVNYTKANWKKVGDISFAWGLITLVRLASKTYRA